MGYVQGMNIIASAIIAHTRDIDQSSSVFNALMTKNNYSLIYKGNLETGVKLSEIEKMEWVSEVSILSFGKGTKNTKTSSFEFSITTND